MTALPVNGMRAIHPGEIIAEELMKPMGIDVMELSQRTGIKIKDLKPVTKQKKPITAEIAEGLGKAFATSAAYWMNMQVTYNRKKGISNA